MDTTAPSTQDGQSGGFATLGSGWVWPAALLSVFVALMYVPGHSPSSGGIDDLIATIAVLYVVGLSVVGVRFVRGVIVRIGGSREQIVLLGSGPDPLISALIRPRWRLAAIIAGGIVPLAAVAAAARVAVAVDPATNAHAIAVLALFVNAVIAVGLVVPAPGFTGWALLLGLVDLAGALPDQRVRRTARLAQSIGIPIFLATGLAAALFGGLMLALPAMLLAFVTWSGSQAAVGQDATVRFLAAHVAGDLARPMTSFAAPDEPIGDLMARLRTDDAVVAVEAAGGFLGAIGPRQLMTGDAARRKEGSVEAMVPLGSLRLLRRAASAVELLPEIARHGFAIVTDPDGLGYVEASDLAKQIQIWVALGDRRAARAAPQADERKS